MTLTYVHDAYTTKTQNTKQNDTFAAKNVAPNITKNLKLYQRQRNADKTRRKMRVTHTRADREKKEK